MISSVIASKRSRPILGTFFSIECNLHDDHLVTSAFQLASDLEGRFSRFQSDSEITRWNRDPAQAASNFSIEFQLLLNLAREIETSSDAAFTIFPDPIHPKQMDLSGIAKGAIVDTVVDFLTVNSERLPGQISGCINAGGDLRFFGDGSSGTTETHLRLGSLSAPIVRQFRLPYAALASSSLSVATCDEKSSTRYYRNPRFDLNKDFTAVVSAPSCAIADAMTKVAMFADSQIISHCAQKYGAQILIFDSNGNVIEQDGAQ